MSDVVITMVPDAPDVEKAALGPGGIIEGLRSGGIYIDMSTSAPATTRKIGQAMAAKGIRMVDAPVGRTVDNAHAGTLAIMMGGDPADVEEVKPILACMGDSFTWCGPLGNGHALKLVNNFVSGGIVALLSEALAFGLKAGLTVETVMAGVGSTFARSGILSDVLPAKAFKGDFTPGFMTSCRTRICASRSSWPPPRAWTRRSAAACSRLCSGRSMPATGATTSPRCCGSTRPRRASGSASPGRTPDDAAARRGYSVGSGSDGVPST